MAEEMGMARYNRRGQRITEDHERSMWRYDEHAWSTAVELAQLLEEEARDAGVSLASLRRAFESYASEKLYAYERENYAEIAGFIQKTPSQWGGALRRIFKGAEPAQKLWFIVIAIIACVRARELISLRDDFRMALAPGRGYRVTTAEMYAFGQQTTDIFCSGFSWPSDVFQSAGIFGLYDGEDESNEESE
jgi:hypothetical protein